MNHNNYVLNMKKKITISFLLSLLLFLLTFWTAAYSLYAASMAEAMCFFVLTYFILEKYEAGIDAFYEKIDLHEDGHASERVVNYLIEEIL